MAEHRRAGKQISMRLLPTDGPPLHAVRAREVRADSQAAHEILSPLTNQPVPHLLCAGCKKNLYLLGEAMFVVHDQLWESAFSADDRECLGPLCIECLEARLKRPLKLEDFTNAYGNFIEISEWHRSARLLERLGAGSAQYEERRAARLGRDCAHPPYEPRAVHRFCIHDDALLSRLNLLRSKL